MQHEARSDVSPPSQPDLLTPIVTGAFGEAIDFTNVEIIIDTNDINGIDTHTTPAPPALSPDMPPLGFDLTQPQPGAGCQDPEACAVLRADNFQPWKLI